MPLPSIFLPASIGDFILSNSQGVTLLDQFSDVRRGAGEPRRRRTATFTEREVEVESKKINQTEVFEFNDWYENTLLAGARSFSVRLHKLGSGKVWWEAYWVEPPTLVPTMGRWVIRGKLRLVGRSQVASPATGNAAVEFSFFLEGEAAIRGETSAAVEFTFYLSTSASAAVEMRFWLERPGFELREDGFYEMREDSGRERRM